MTSSDFFNFFVDDFLKYFYEDERRLQSKIGFRKLVEQLETEAIISSGVFK